MAEKFTLPSCLKGETLPLYLWQPQGEPKGLVQFVHGMAEHMERYEEPAAYLAAQGYVVVGHTHLGHGPMTRTPGFFGKKGGWDNLLHDIHQVRLWAQQRYPQLPYYILGHSMGSFLVRCYLMANAQGVKGAILSGTGYYPLALTLAGKMMAGFFILIGQGMKPNAFINQFVGGKGLGWLSRDEQVQAAYAADPLCGFPFTAYGFRDLFDGLNRLALPENLKNLPRELPVYLFSGDQDPVGQMGAGVKKVAEEYAAAGLENVIYTLYPQGRHEMFNELNRQEVYEKLAAWLG